MAPPMPVDVVDKARMAWADIRRAIPDRDVVMVLRGDPRLAVLIKQRHC